MRVQVSAAFAPYAEERTLHASQELEPQEGGSLLARLRVEGLEEIAEFLLSFGEHVEVCEPPELRARVREKLARAIARYEDPRAT